MLYSEQLGHGLLVNRGSSPTSASSKGTSFISWVLKIVFQRLCLAFPQLSCSQLHPLHGHHQPWFPSLHPWLWFCFFRFYLRRLSSQLRFLRSLPFLPYSCPVHQFKTCFPILIFKYCQFPKEILQSSAMCLPDPSVL